MFKKFLLVVLYLSSFSAFSDTYHRVWTLSCLGNGAYYSTNAAACSSRTDATYTFTANGEVSPYYCLMTYTQTGAMINPTADSQCTSTSSCPNGGTMSGSYCINAPSCVSPQIRDSVSPYACNSPSVPVCTSTQSPILTNCTLPTGVPVPCLDGSTVYVPSVCDNFIFDQYRTPAPGVSITCNDGRTAPAGSSCYSRFLNDLFNNDPKALDSIKFVGFGTGALITTSAIGFMISKNLAGDLKLTMPMQSLRLNNPNGGLPVLATSSSQISGFVSHFNVESTVPKYTLGGAIEKFFQSDPVSTYANAFKQASIDAGVPVLINTNTGAVTMQSNAAPLSRNQLTDFAVAFDIGIPVSTYHPIAVQPVTMPLSQISNYVLPEDAPWIGPALPTIEQDFQRVFSPGSVSLPAYNWPNVAVSSPFIMPIPSLSTPPLASFTPSSPASYTPAPPVVSTLLNPATNPNPSGTDAQTSTVTTSTDSINPSDSYTPPPEVPDIYPDTSTYFLFLNNTVNPFTFDIKNLLPTLPSLACTYEIHRTIFGFAFDLAPCLPLQPLRDVLAWAFGLLSVWSCFVIIFKAEV